MKLTPLDIHHKEFHRSIRGYSEEEVDVFLDEVAEEFERLFKENVGLQEEIEQLKEKMEQYKVMEQTLQNTLFTAQKTAEELINNARKESELILRDAELKAKDMIQQALAEKQRIQQIFLRIKQAEEEFRIKFRGLLEDYGKLIREIPVPEDILLLTAPSEEGEDVNAVAAALVLDRPSAEQRLVGEGEPAGIAPTAASAETVADAEAAPAVETETAKETAPALEAAPALETAPALEEAVSEAVVEGGSAEAAIAEQGATAAPAARPEVEPSPGRHAPAEEAAARAGPEDTAEIPSMSGGPSESLLSSDATTVSSDDGHVRGLTLGEVGGSSAADTGGGAGGLGDDIDLPDFLKDPVDRTAEERERLRRNGVDAASGILAEREEDSDIEEIS